MYRIYIYYVCVNMFIYSVITKDILNYYLSILKYIYNTTDKGVI